MNIFDLTRKHYNAAGVHPTTDPDDSRSQFAVDRYKDYFFKLIRLGMCTLVLGCNAGRFTFAMEDRGAIATGIDFAEIPIRHAKKVVHRRKSQCQFNIGHMAALPYKDNSFDFALLQHNIGYLTYEMLERLSVQLKRILSDNGTFVVTMHDELVKRIGEENLPEQYDILTGLIGGSRTIPDKGTYVSPWQFWTVAFAKYIVEKHLHLEEIVQIEENCLMLVFCNKLG